MLGMRTGIMVGLALAVPLAGAQVRASGGVSGHVYSADTNQPLRLATVVLVSTGTGLGGGGGMATTDLQGGFVLGNVQAGTYAVIARMGGYVTAAAPDQPGGGPAAPIVRVEDGQTTPVEIRLERGGVLAGTVQFEDGTPAEGVDVRPWVRNSAGTWQMFISRGVTSGHTDDRGRYRVAGLPAGTYTLEADVPLPVAAGAGGLRQGFFRAGGGSTLRVYSGGVFRVKNAVPLELHTLEERTDADLQIPLTGLHEVRGSVGVVGSGRSVAGGTVRLLNADDRTSMREAQILPDGSFAMSSVPTGDYVIRVEARAERRSGQQAVPLQPLEQPLRVEGDLLNLGFDVQPATTQ